MASIFGSDVGSGEVDFYISPGGYISISSVRSEHSTRLLATAGPSSGAQEVSLSDIVWGALDLNADNRFIDYRLAGALSLNRIQIIQPPVAPKLYTVTSGAALSINMNGFGVRGSATYTTPVQSDIFELGATTTARWAGFSVSNSAGSIINIEDGASPATSVTAYTTAATHTVWTTRPSTLVGVHIWAIGGGGGGGSGARLAAGGVRGGGGGGSPGSVVEGYFAPADMPSGTFSFTIPAAAAGGTSITANDTNGNPGVAASVLTVGPLVCVNAGAAGGGTAAGGAAGTSAVTMWAVSQASTGSAGGVGGTTPAVGSTGFNFASGGGGGAGITAAEVPNAGATGGITALRTGYVRTSLGGGAGGASGLPGSAGNSPPTTERAGGTGGGGGGSHATGAGAPGGAGGAGAGGGGGAASTNGANSGAGGAGGLAKVIITLYHVV